MTPKPRTAVCEPSAVLAYEALDATQALLAEVGTWICGLEEPHAAVLDAISEQFAHNRSVLADYSLMLARAEADRG